ncbi:MAG: hypothetical protein V4510_10870 [bacterium]
MTNVPAFSIFSATSELAVTAAVLYVLWRAYYRNDLRVALLATTLAFELAVNIAYMSYRLAVPSQSTAPDWLKAFQGAHGVLSLVMFIGLIILAGMAYSLNKDKRNFFRESPGLTLTFTVLWMVSVVSGETIFVVTYLV